MFYLGSLVGSNTACIVYNVPQALVLSGRPGLFHTGASGGKGVDPDLQRRERTQDEHGL